MSVTVVEYTQLNEREKEKFAKKMADGSLYQQLWYVACLSDNQFYLVVYGDLEAVLLVPFRKKMGVRYAYRPLFLQKNIFYGDASKFEVLVAALQKTVRFGDIALDQLGGKNIFDTVFSRTNYELPLDKPYTELRQSFSKNHKRNINKSKCLSIKETTDVTALLTIFEAEKTTSFKPKALKNIRKTIHQLVQNTAVKPYLKIMNAYDDGDVVGAFLLLHYNYRIYYLLGTSKKHMTSLSDKALYRLFDDLIQTCAGTKTILDFEGSDLPGVARFFRGFGAQETHYYAVKWNKLPFPLNRLKR